MTSLQDKNNTKIINDEESANRVMPPELRRMSNASRRYAGEKGYLDEDDKIIRKYDKSGDGNFTIEDAKAMAADFRSTLLSKKMYQKVIISMAVLLVVSWAGNFALTFATLALTKQLDTQGGDLTDMEGHMLATKSKGDSAHFIPEFTSDNPADLRHLEVGSWAPIGLIDKSRADMLQVWADHTNGTPTLVDYTLDDVNYSSTVQLNTQEPGTCDVYEGIEVDEDLTEFEQYKLNCCGDDTQLCDVFAQVTSSSRKLWSKKSCFSPMSTVIEQTKGKLLLKDLKFGDSVLAANQVFRPYVFDMHSHSSKPTEFLQLHTEVSDNDPETAPIELTPGHMIFVDGKDLPILASDVKLGDSLVGTSGPTKVTKISTVMRDGLFDPLTADATLFVDGVLASSMVDANEYAGPSASDANYLNFGLFKIHVHTFMGRIIAPLFHSFCNNVDSKHCETHVDDGEGGAMNILMESGSVLLKKSPLVQGLALALLPAAGAVSLFGYYAFMGLASIAFVMSVFKALVIAKEQSTGQAKIKVA